MYTNIYLKNIAPEVTDEQLEKAVSEYGKVTSCKIMRVSERHALVCVLCGCLKCCSAHSLTAHACFKCVCILREQVLYNLYTKMLTRLKHWP